jgi:hypothetical protein
MNTKGEACLLIELVVSSLVVIGPFSNRPQEDLFREFPLKFLVVSLIADCQLASLDVLILDVVDIEVLLALVRVDWVQLEEVLPTNSTPKPVQASQQHQHHSCGKYRNNISTPIALQITNTHLITLSDRHSHTLYLVGWRREKSGSCCRNAEQARWTAT